MPALLAEPEQTLSVKEVATMQFREYDVSSASQTSSSVINDAHSRRSVRERRISLSNRVRAINCMLEDIEAQIQKLRQERIHLNLVREGLTDKLSGESLHELGS